MPRDDTSASVVGEVLCEARERAGLTQEALAARARMDRSYISDVERGEASVSLDRFLRICLSIGTPASAVILRIEQKLNRRTH